MILFSSLNSGISLHLQINHFMHTGYMKLKYIAFLLLIFVGFVSCSDDNPEPELQSGRTVLVYMIESNLGSSLQSNIDNMIKGAQKQNLNGGHLIIYYSPTGQEPELIELKEGANGIVTRNHIKNYAIQSAIDPKVMNSVIQDVVTMYPGESYGLILSSHGMSWLPTEYTSMLRSFGEENKKSMEINELAEGLPNDLFDYILIDACYMGSIECVYELRHKTDYIIASAAEIWAYGFPYQTIIPYLFSGTAQVEKIAKTYYDFYENMKDYSNATVVVVKTDELDNLTTATRNILTNTPLDSIYALSRVSMQRYDRFNTALLYDFDEYISKLDSTEKYNDFSAALNKAVVCKYNTETDFYGKKFTHYSGLSVYIPRSKYITLNNWYWNPEQLEWATAVYK